MLRNFYKVKLTLIIVIIMTLLGCKERSINNVTADCELNDIRRFKTWLSDTLTHLNKQSLDSIKVIVPSDSLHLELQKTYRIRIDPSQRIDDNDIKMAMFLLENNDTVPKKEFNLSFNIIHFYDIGVSDLKYSHEYEFNSFIVSDTSNKIKYSFVKSNLVNKEIVDK